MHHCLTILTDTRLHMAQSVYKHHIGIFLQYCYTVILQPDHCLAFLCDIVIRIHSHAITNIIPYPLGCYLTITFTFHASGHCFVFLLCRNSTTWSLIYTYLLCTHYNNDNDNDKVFYSTLIIQFIIQLLMLLHIKYDIGLWDKMLRHYTLGSASHFLINIYFISQCCSLVVVYSQIMHTLFRYTLNWHTHHWLTQPYYRSCDILRQRKNVRQ